LVRYIAQENENDGLTVNEPAPKAYLALVVGGQVSQTFPLRGEIHIGRDKSNGVVIADQKVSRRHAHLSPIEDTFILNDYGSANGTYLNGVQISQPTRLKNMDQIGIGDTSFLFTTSLPTAQLTSEPGFLPARPAAQLSSQNSIPIAMFPLDNKPLWMVIGCLGLMVVALLLILALVLGLFIGSNQAALVLIGLF
jgi:pSer/pThr/pTyr-binding forkhead associated (FHA) protein